ncbi:MAG TPA: phosphocholine cytidylyltransferase family protein [Streptosporangiaceae bacterium]|nr:phosphocholine cytidylyltransferase family protein [Streptosporangiaceae bacterium]
MIGMVLAAGAGRRLRPDTDALPKALLPVAGQTTILEITLRNLAAVGLSDIVIVVGYAADAVADRVSSLERASGLTIDLVHNDRAQEWNNAYSLWLAREYFSRGVLLVNGDTVHPASVEKSLLAASAATREVEAKPLGRLIIAIDDIKPLADEEMKVMLDGRGMMRRITKQMNPDVAHGEYMGVTLIEPSAAVGLADALETTWRRDAGLYYEDGYAEFAERGGYVLAAPIGAVDWVEVDNHADLRRAREIAGRC